MALKPIKLFYSYSHKDEELRDQLQVHLALLTRQEIITASYDRDINAGEEWAGKVDEHLNSADIILLLVSPDFIASDYCYDTEMQRAMQRHEAGAARVIPVVLRPCDWPSATFGKLQALPRDGRPVTTWKDRDEAFLSISQGIRRIAELLAAGPLAGPRSLGTVATAGSRKDTEQGSALELNTAHGQEQIEETYKTSYSEIDLEAILERIYLFLQLDQFPSGVWGASIEPTRDLYGKQNDPGSISVSVSCTRAITALSGSHVGQPIQLFRRYLFSRRSPRGAFGMKRFIGSSFYPAEHTFENARHTAAALSFFLFYDGYRHECASGALSYLLKDENRTPSGLWVDQGDLSDLSVDPLTVANVIEALETAYRELINDQEVTMDSQEIDRINDAIRNGVEHLFNTRFRTPHGLWVYRYTSQQEYERVLENTYRYTAGVLSNIVNSCERLGIRTSETEALLENLFKVAHQYGGGLPTSPSSNIPSLSATVNLISTAYYFSNLSSQAQSSIRQVFVLCNSKTVLELAMAPGWSAIAMLASSMKQLDLFTEDHTNHLDRLAEEMLVGDPNIVRIPQELIGHEIFVRTLLRRRQSN